ncbi:hypothetical protein [Luteibacter sp. ME-Dv--P-043b]|uniref:virion core protein, T7 gp14 family n=1 Tax=Luteibacter sp. ME-Dv--P-043b TaxID=3040291 RepID=UPI0025548593|nr:hypothetical protein [Luteibacter sp. ME-Dv--P-043b]
MCAIAAVPIIMAVVAAGTAVYSANQQKRAMEETLKVQQEQTDAAAQAQTDDRLKAAREQRAAARTASAESGASGNSTNAILTDILMQSGRDVSRIEKNRVNGQIENTQQARSRSSEINGQLISGLSSSASAAANGGASWYAKTHPATIPTS